MPKKPKNAEPKKPAASQDEPVQDPAPQHLHDETRKPLKAPPGGIPPNLPRHFPGKGGGHQNFVQSKNRSFRHQGR